MTDPSHSDHLFFGVLLWQNNVVHLDWNLRTKEQFIALCCQYYEQHPSLSTPTHEIDSIDNSHPAQGPVNITGRSALIYFVFNVYMLFYIYVYVLLVII